MGPHIVKGTPHVRKSAYATVPRNAAAYAHPARRTRVYVVRAAPRDSGAYVALGVLIIGAISFLGGLEALRFLL